MLHKELDESLRNHLLRERKGKSLTANAVIRRLKNPDIRKYREYIQGKYREYIQGKYREYIQVTTDEDSEYWYNGGLNRYQAEGW